MRSPTGIVCKIADTGHLLTPCSEGSWTPKIMKSSGRRGQVEAGGEGRRRKNGHPKVLPARVHRSQHPQAPAPTSPTPMLTHFLPMHLVQHSSHHQVNTSLNAWHCTMLASQAKGAVFMEEALQLREAVVEGGLQEDVLHGVLYS